MASREHPSASDGARVQIRMLSASLLLCVIASGCTGGSRCGRHGNTVIDCTSPSPAPSQAP